MKFAEREYVKAVVEHPNVNEVLDLLSNQSVDDLKGTHELTGANLLFYAVQRPNDSEGLLIARHLVEELEGPDCSAIDVNEQTALFFAARDGHLKCVKYLMSKGCDEKIVDTAGQNCLFYASRDGRDETIEFLSQTVDVNVADRLGQTALFYAVRNGRESTVDLLLKLGADPAMRDAQNHYAHSYAHKTRHATVRAKLRGLVALAHVHTGNALKNPIKQNLQQRRKCYLQFCITLNTSSWVKQAESLRQRQAELKGEAAAVSETETGPANKDAFNKDAGYKKIRSDGADEESSARENVWIFANDTKVEHFEKSFPSLAAWSRVPQTRFHPLDDFRMTWCRAGLTILLTVSNYPDGWLFARPVDVKKWSCPDYYDVIKEPRDFHTIKKKLRNLEYPSVAIFLEDMDLVFKNCFRYNPDTSPVHASGKKLEAFYLSLLKQSDFLKFKHIENLLEKYFSSTHETDSSQERTQQTSVESGDGPGPPDSSASCSIHPSAQEPLSFSHTQNDDSHQIHAQ